MHYTILHFEEYDITCQWHMKTASVTLGYQKYHILQNGYETGTKKKKIIVFLVKGNGWNNHMYLKKIQILKFCYINLKNILKLSYHKKLDDQIIASRIAVIYIM